eukprot:3003030-Rhodomonas_salina.1
MSLAPYYISTALAAAPYSVSTALAVAIYAMPVPHRPQHSTLCQYRTHGCRVMYYCSTALTRGHTLCQYRSGRMTIRYVRPHRIKNAEPGLACAMPVLRSADQRVGRYGGWYQKITCGKRDWARRLREGGRAGVEGEGVGGAGCDVLRSPSDTRSQYRAS